MASLIHLIYASASVVPMHELTLTDVLIRSRRNNERLGVTGVLLHSGGSFFQVLEGESDVVDQLFGRIANDPRHHETATIIREPIARRSFGEWTMGYTLLSQRELIETAGMNDFFGKGSFLHQLDRGRAKKLLTAFSDGRWRARLGEPGQQATAPSPLMAAER